MPYLPPHQIQKIHKIKDVQERIKLIDANIEISDDEKNQILTILHKRLDEIRADKRKRYEERKKEYTEYKIYANTKQNAFLKEQLKLMQEYTKDPNLSIRDVIEAKVFSKDTLKKEEVQQNQLKTQQEQEKIQLIKQALRNLGGLATNFNQITHNYNQRGLFQKSYSLTKEERETAINTIASLEEMLINLTNYYNENA